MCLKWIAKKDKNRRGGTFIDLGHGTGKGMLTAAFTNDFDKCVGIEFLPSLNQLSLDLKKKYDDLVKDTASEDYRNIFHDKTHVPAFECIEGDFIEKDWSGSDVVLANSTCYEG